MASLKPFDESRKITVFLRKNVSSIIFYFLKKITLSSYQICFLAGCDVLVFAQLNPYYPTKSFYVVR